MFFVYKDKDGNYKPCEGGVDVAEPGTDKTVYGLPPFQVIYRQWWLLQQCREASFRYFESRQRDEWGKRTHPSS